MPRGEAWIAVDWGTTNRRAWRVGADGVARERLSDGLGVLSVPPGGFPDAVADLRRTLDAGLVVASGMVGSNRGWTIVPYVDAPADLEAVADGASEVAPDFWIAPGVALRAPGRADVMRGEEVQALGAAVDPRWAEATICQPGTHCKWIELRDCRIVDFSTAMTGELFGLLRGGGILAGMLDGTVADGEAFRSGVARGAGATDLAAALFEVRASVILERLAAEDAAAYASGVLIGADVGARDLAGRKVALLATGSLAPLYAAAIEFGGGAPLPVDADAAFLAGIAAVRARLPRG